MRGLAAALLLAGLLSPAARGEALVIRGVRVIVDPARTIDGVRIVIEDGKVKAVGTMVPEPPLARILEASGRTVMAGLVCPATALGTSVKRVTRPGTEVRVRRLDDVDPDDPVWKAAREAGVTTLALAPAALGVGGRAAVVKPAGGSREAMSAGVAEPLLLGFDANSSAIGAFRGGFDRARKWMAALAAHETAAAAAEKAAAELAKKHAAAVKKAKDEGKPPPAAPKVEGKPVPARPPEDPRTMPFVRALRGEIPCLVRVDGGAGDVAHLMPLLAELRLAPILVMDGTTAVETAASLKAAKVTVLLAAALETDPVTRRLVNAPRELLRSGVRFGLLPAGSLGELRHRLAILVKTGLPRAAALAAVTTTPAALLGMEKRLGRVVPGADADLVFLDGDPLDPLARVTRVLIAGETVYERPEVRR